MKRSGASWITSAGSIKRRLPASEQRRRFRHTGFDQCLDFVYLSRHGRFFFPPTVNTPSGISSGALHGVVWLTVDGRGNFQNSADLRSLVRTGISDGSNRIVLDLLRCSGLDSTFMGMLSCVAAKLEDAGGCLHVVNAEGKNGDLLRGLGLDEVFTVEDGTELVEHGACAGAGLMPEEVPLAAVPKTECSKQDQRKICLEAHEALADLHEANAEKFRDVITLMREECNSSQGTH